jgi:cephalosporin-C deacetylase
MSKQRRLFLAFAFLWILVFACVATGQEQVGLIRVQVTPDRPDWLYQPGQTVSFTIEVKRDGHPLVGPDIKIELGPEMLEPSFARTQKLEGKEITLQGTMAQAGFLRCIATLEFAGKKYRGLATAGFAPEQIKPTVEDPADFDVFWKEGKEALAKIPLEPKLTLLPEYSTSKVDVYHVSLQNVGNTEASTSRLYGILCEPKADGKFPALLGVPGAGVRAYRGMVEMAEKGIITFQIGIHGIPVNLDQLLYDSLGRGAFNGYWVYNLDNRDRYYYHRVYLGCVRGNDFLVSRPKWDGQHLAVAGGSQGGALSLITAALDERINGLAAYYPALCDLTGYLQNRAGGWPHMFKDPKDGHRTAEKLKTAQYYDVVNFARRIKVPGLYTWGYNDETCPPTSMFSAYNVITAPKKLLLALETGHFNIKEQADKVDGWLETFLKTGKAPLE